MGFIHPQKKGLLEQLENELDERGNVKGSEKHYQNNIPKIFACGDIRRGQSVAVWAISDGRECAKKANEYLMGISKLKTKDASVITVLRLGLNVFFYYTLLYREKRRRCLLYISA